MCQCGSRRHLAFSMRRRCARRKRMSRRSLKSSSAKRYEDASDDFDFDVDVRISVTLSSLCARITSTTDDADATRARSGDARLFGNNDDDDDQRRRSIADGKCVPSRAHLQLSRIAVRCQTTRDDSRRAQRPRRRCLSHAPPRRGTLEYVFCLDVNRASLIATFPFCVTGAGSHLVSTERALSSAARLFVTELLTHEHLRDDPVGL